MANSKKEEVEKKEETTPKAPEGKKKSNKILYIVLAVFLFFVIITIAGFWFAKKVLKKGFDAVNEGKSFIEQIYEDSEIEKGEKGEEKEKTTGGKVDGELEKTNLITEKFPKDIPLPGGVVTSSSYNEWSIEVKIDVNSSVEEIIEWYSKALEEEGWEITAKSSEDYYDEGWITGQVKFAKEAEGRKGAVKLDSNPFQDATSVRVEETLW